MANIEDNIIIPEVPGVDTPVPPIVDDTCIDVNPEPLVVDEEPIDLPSAPVTCVSDNNSESHVTTIGEYFGTLQESVVSIWKYHLSTNKHYIHVVLNETYHGMLGLVDSLIEQYQGIVVSTLPQTDYVNTINTLDYPEPLSYLFRLRDFVLTGRGEVFSEHWSELLSTVDDILSLLDSTIYKLNSFKEEPVMTFESFCYALEHELNESFDNCDDDNFDDEEE